MPDNPMLPTIAPPIGVQPTVWAAMSPQQQIQTSQAIQQQQMAALDTPLNQIPVEGPPTSPNQQVSQLVPTPSPVTPGPAPTPAPSALPQWYLDSQAVKAPPAVAPNKGYTPTGDPEADWQAAKAAGVPYQAPPSAGPSSSQSGGPVAPLTPAPWRATPGGADDQPRNQKIAGSGAHNVALVDPNSIAKVQAGYDARGQAIASEGDAAGDLGRAEAKSADDLARGKLGEALTAGKAADAYKLTADTTRAKAQAHMAAADQFAQEIQADHVDPNRMWANASTGNKIMWGIARVFGGIAQGALHQSSNQIADQLQHMVDQDVAAQKANFEARRDTSNSMYARAFRETGNADEAEALARSYALKSAASTTESMGQASQSPIRLAKARQVKASLDGKIAENSVTEEKDSQASHKYVQASAGGDILHDPKVAKLSAELQQHAAENGRPISPGEATKRAAETYYPGSQTGGYSDISKVDKGATDPKAAVANQSVEDALAQARELRAEIAKGGQASPARTAALKVKADELAGSLRSATPGRAPPIEHFRGLVPADPNAYDPSGKNLAQIDAVIKGLEGQKKRHATSGAPSYFTPDTGDDE